MVCSKCGYKEVKPKKFQNIELCSICSKFAPRDPGDLEDYIQEKIDWKLIDLFRKFSNEKTNSKKESMSKQASLGILVTRAPLGYEVIQGALHPNEEASRVHSLFKTFLNRKYSLNTLAKNFSLSVNGLKKILSNRTYLGEIKFDGKIFKGNHKPIISQEIFYAVQRKLGTYLRPRKN